MIAFYAWTDTLLLNAYRIRTSDYAAEEADLIVLNLPRVSQRVISEIEKSGVFRKVIRIEDVHRGKRNVVQKALKMFSAKQYYQAISRQLTAIEGSSYDLLFTGGLWADSLFLYQFMSRRNPDVRIALMEEGIVNYGGMRTALWCDAINRKRDFLFRHFFFAGIYSKGCAALKKLYLTEPAACLESGKLELCRIRQDAQAYRTLIAKLGDEAHAAPYQQRRVVFFMQPESEDDGRTTTEIVCALSRRFSAEQVIVRAHPDTHSVRMLKETCPGVHVDLCDAPFEAIADQIDWSDKILVARASSCMFMPVFCYGQQPKLYFVYKLFESGDRSLIGPMVDKVRTLYADENRVCLPESIHELQQMLAAREGA